MSSINEEVQNINKWIQNNKLTLNILKTNYIIFHRNKTLPPNASILRINNTVINEVTHVKFLGITVDNKLSWNKHITSVCNKVNRMSGILYLTRHLLNKEALRHVYHTLVYPNIIYCSTIWSSVPTSKIKPLIIVSPSG